MSQLFSHPLWSTTLLVPSVFHPFHPIPAARFFLKSARPKQWFLGMLVGWGWGVRLPPSPLQPFLRSAGAVKSQDGVREAQCAMGFAIFFKLRFPKKIWPLPTHASSRPIANLWRQTHQLAAVRVCNGAEFRACVAKEEGSPQ